MFQSTHPRGVRLPCGSTSSGCFHVSIHAPARGATRSPLEIAAPLIVSIHAPARGATVLTPKTADDATGFNPRTREGCDVYLDFDPAPLDRSFQSTHPRGVRLPDPAARSQLHLFQSTHPRGVRPLSSSARACCNAFQSTHPRGVRPTRLIDVTPVSVFQSTHPRGVRLFDTRK